MAAGRLHGDSTTVPVARGKAPRGACGSTCATTSPSVAVSGGAVHSSPDRSGEHPQGHLAS